MCFGITVKTVFMARKNESTQTAMCLLVSQYFLLRILKIMNKVPFLGDTEGDYFLKKVDKISYLSSKSHSFEIMRIMLTEIIELLSLSNKVITSNYLLNHCS